MVMNFAPGVDTTLLNNIFATSISAGGGDLAGIVDAVAAHDEPRSVLLVLLGAHTANELPVGHITPAFFWYFLSPDELDGVGRVLGAPADSIS